MIIKMCTAAQLLMITTCLLITGCAPDSIQNEASITGSKSDNNGVFDARSRIYPVKIDSHVIMFPDLRTNPINVTPGFHDIIFHVERNAFPHPEVSGGEIRLMFQAAENYTLCITNPIPPVNRNGQVSGWSDQAVASIKDEDGIQVSEQIPVQMEIPVYSSFPIFIPTH